MNGQAYALDFGAVMALGSALGADLRMLAEVLPAVEKAALARFDDRDDEDYGSEI